MCRGEPGDAATFLMLHILFQPEPIYSPEKVREQLKVNPDLSLSVIRLELSSVDYCCRRSFNCQQIILSTVTISRLVIDYIYLLETTGEAHVTL